MTRIKHERVSKTWLLKFAKYVTFAGKRVAIKDLKVPSGGFKTDLTPIEKKKIESGKRIGTTFGITSSEGLWGVVYLK